MKKSYEIWEVLNASDLSRAHYGTIAAMCRGEGWAEQVIRNKISRKKEDSKLCTHDIKIFYKLTVQL